MNITTAAWLAYAAPLAGCLLLTLAGTWLPRRYAGIVASVAMFVSFVFALRAWTSLRALEPEERSVTDSLFTWLSSGSFRVDLGILIDPLAIVMLLVVSGVGFLIHVYSIGYMHGDDEERRYFAYLNLFVFSMLTLVLASNFVLLLVGWGLVGLSSYLLIGYWHQKPSAVAAAKKAFVMNAIGDVGLALGIFLLFRETGAVDYLAAFDARDELGFGSSTMNWICLLFLVGAVAKSAQLPLHTWLPDAMEGPTPVSALIHAATMVTAGVYLIARLNPLYAYAPDIRTLIVVIGVAGLLMAGIIGLAQTDIKRVIAYSTMSQIAYMFVGAGLAAYWTGIFHLLTHAFFKALLFMGAGVVIHALEGEQDIDRMGGLRHFMPKTFACFLIGTLALVGIVPLSGGLSKDAILASGLERGDTLGYVAFAGGIAGAFLTGLYAFRLLLRVFAGPPSELVDSVGRHHTEHGEGPKTMLWPVYVLALLSIVGGLLQFPGVTHAFTSWLEPITYGVPYSTEENMLEPSTTNEWVTTALAMGAGLAGAAIAFALYGRGPRTIAVPRGLRALAERRFYWDELYDALFYRPSVGIARMLRTAIERPIFLRSLDLSGSLTQTSARALAALQTGAVRAYALVFALGAGALVLYFMLAAG